MAICFRPILGDKSADGVQTRSLTDQPTSRLMTIDLSRFVDNAELNKCEKYHIMIATQSAAVEESWAKVPVPWSSGSLPRHPTGTN